MKHAALLLAVLVACSDDSQQAVDAHVDTPDDGTPPDCNCGDAPTDTPGPDAVPSTVVEVPCPANPGQIASVVTTPGFNYAITVPTVPAGSIVRFQVEAFHNAVSGTVTGGVPSPDGRFSVPFGGNVCLQFTAPGSFPFYCSPHLFTGTLTVVPPA